MSDCELLVPILRALQEEGATRIANQIVGRHDGAQPDKDDLVAQARASVRATALIQPRQAWQNPVEEVMAQVLRWAIGEPLMQVRAEPDTWVNMASWSAAGRHGDRTALTRPENARSMWAIGEMPSFEWINANAALRKRSPQIGAGTDDERTLPGPIALGPAGST